MSLLAWVAIVCFAVYVSVGAAVAVRLLRLAYRTRGLPELVIGSALLLFAAINFPLAVSANYLLARFGPDAYLAAMSVAQLASSATVAGVFLFTYLVFRRHSPWALVLVIAGGLARAAIGFSYIYTAAGTLAELPLDVAIETLRPIYGARMVPATLVYGVGFGWTAFEALRYHAAMRRRLLLGMADPVVVNRFAVWGGGNLVGTFFTVAIVVCYLAGLSDESPVVTRLLVSLSGLVNAVTWLLTFLPPAGYLAWVRRRAGGSP
ncbi:MAG: hypothetical protein MJE66_12605 [Proteobacteria bacterium]|nr:hypothetical protein [Pseudomonadota bacterium]